MAVEKTDGPIYTYCHSLTHIKERSVRWR